MLHYQWSNTHIHIYSYPIIDLVIFRYHSDNTTSKRKRTNGITMIYKTLHRKLEKPKYTVISRNTHVKAGIHLENVEIHLKIVQMNLQWIENGEITHI